MNKRTPCKCDFCWKFHRTPTLGGNTLTVLEALTDSAIVAFNIENKELLQDRLNRMVNICRELLREERLAILPYLKIYRCTYRETDKTRCNMVPGKPVIENEIVKYRCAKHSNDKKSYEPESKIKVRYPSMCVTEFVYCWHCGQQFKKADFVKGQIDTFEKCPHCQKGFEDLSEESQKAVLMTLKPLEGIELSSFI